jgi:WhiB family transcriptional regulator, redox-sensing transcriptional regulator
MSLPMPLAAVSFSPAPAAPPSGPPSGPPSAPPPAAGGWRAAAACARLPASVVFARRPTDAEPALRACATCTVRRECELTVAPAESWFDGVCAGRLWRNGRPVDLPAGLPEGAADRVRTV